MIEKALLPEGCRVYPTFAYTTGRPVRTLRSAEDSHGSTDTDTDADAATDTDTDTDTDADAATDTDTDTDIDTDA
jgi:hypothetical protein